MLFTSKTLVDYSLECRDGRFGRVREFYFDDLHWTVRYLVADTGDWLPGRTVLISPYSLGAVSRDKKSLFVNLTRRRIEDGPSVETDKPVSQQFELAHSEHFGWPPYWSGPHLWGGRSYVERDREKWARARPEGQLWDYRLRSTKEVARYQVEASDGPMGQVEDFVLDDEAWALRYLVVDTRAWWPGARVLIAPKWIERVSWGDGKVLVNLSREAVKASPPYSREDLLTRDYEERLHEHYEAVGYWNHEALLGAAPTV
jgi:hypothetical protein